MRRVADGDGIVNRQVDLFPDPQLARRIRLGSNARALFVPDASATSAAVARTIARSRIAAPPLPEMPQAYGAAIGAVCEWVHTQPWRVSIELRMRNLARRA